MIRVTLTTLVFIYLAIFLVAVFIGWVTWNWRRLRREKAAMRNRLRCTICAFEFEDHTSTLLARCPRCGSLNERYRFSTL